MATYPFILVKTGNTSFLLQKMDLDAVPIQAAERYSANFYMTEKVLFMNGTIFLALPIKTKFPNGQKKNGYVRRKSNGKQNFQTCWKIGKIGYSL